MKADVAKLDEISGVGLRLEADYMGGASLIVGRLQPALVSLFLLLLIAVPLDGVEHACA